MKLDARQESTPEMADRQCAATKLDGAPCTVDPALLIEDEEQPGTYFCFSHAPWLEDARDAARSKAGSRTALKFRHAPRFLTEHDLGDLVTPSDALRWSQVIAGSVVTGRLSSNAASVALKALENWRAAHEAVDVTARLTELERRVAQAEAERLQKARAGKPPAAYMGRDSG